MTAKWFKIRALSARAAALSGCEKFARTPFGLEKKQYAYHFLLGISILSHLGKGVFCRFVVKSKGTAFSRRHTLKNASKIG